MAKLSTMVVIVVISLIGSSFARGQEKIQTEPERYCLLDFCLTERDLVAGGLVAGGAAAGTATVAYYYGPEQAAAAAIAFLAFGHLLFDVVPLAVLGAAAYYYGPEVWQWVGYDLEKGPAAE